MHRNASQTDLLPESWFARDAVVIARELLGKVIRHDGCLGRIVETEAYTTDAASHGRVLTERSRLMHETHARWYVYFTYGMHHCVNVTTNQGGVGAVLIRAVEPLEGIERMQARRSTEDIRKLCSGPGKLCQAFCITKEQNGLPLTASFGIFDAPPVPESSVRVGPRIGIRKDTDLPWRFSLGDSPYASR
ncbi:MAG: DNA-3-methyladenine glycosylase [Patescibacteria group bacterium]